jgi:hypothetical protein
MVAAMVERLNTYYPSRRLAAALCGMCSGLQIDVSRVKSWKRLLVPASIDLHAPDRRVKTRAKTAPLRPFAFCLLCDSSLCSALPLRCWSWAAARGHMNCGALCQGKLACNLVRQSLQPTHPEASSNRSNKNMPCSYIALLYHRAMASWSLFARTDWIAIHRHSAEPLSQGQPHVMPRYLAEQEFADWGPTSKSSLHVTARSSRNQISLCFLQACLAQVEDIW